MEVATLIGDESARPITRKSIELVDNKARRK